MDELDLKILSSLGKNSQLPFYEIARDIEVSPRTIELRYRKLKEKRVIIRSTILIDLSKIGYAGKAYLSVGKKTSAESSTIINELRKIKGIFLIALASGDFDIIALSVIRDIDHMLELTNTVRKIPGIEKVEIAFVPHTIYPANWIHKQSFK